MKVLFAGDFVPRNRLAPLVEKGLFDSIFGEVRDIIGSTDYAIVNFESPIVEDEDIPISKCGPNLHCTKRAVDSIKYAGFNCATLANNHIRDFGNSGVVRTISLLEEQGIDHVGAGQNILDADDTLYKNVIDSKLAIINCCENEFSIATQNLSGANPLNPIRQYYAIQEARNNADYVIIIIHGGHEHYQLPSLRMQDTYRFFIDSGADIVINHHQHCFSGYEFYKGKPIVYGLGNFCMDKFPVRVNQIWNYGYMVIWDTNNSFKIQIIPYDQCGEKPCVRLLETGSFDNKLTELNSIIANRKQLEHENVMYYERCKINIHNVLEPIQNRIIAGLQHKHLLPSLVSKKWLLKLQDFILCESHRDKMDYFFKEENK